MQLPNFVASFVIECNASGTGVGAVSLQNGHPLAYFSKTLWGKSRHFLAYDRSLLAFVLAVEKWKQYLFGKHYEVHTDQESLKHLWENKINTSQVVGQIDGLRLQHCL